MTQQDKELLIKDLCARLPYGVKVKLGDNPNIFDLEYRIMFAVMYGDSDKLEDILDITNIKPYLFPLSSMTERQCYELSSIRSSFQDCWKYIKTPIPLSICNFEQIDFFHKNHLDYRGLIPLGLAIDATGKNIY